MGYIDGHIFRLRSLFLILILLMTGSLLAQESEKISLFRLRVPYYEEKKKNELPTLILTAEEARPIGVRYELKGVKIIWIGDTITERKGIIYTPSAVYDKSSSQVVGNKKIEYRSAAMDLDGVGFDIDQIKQLIHIRSKVKVVLKERLEHHRGENRKLGKVSIKRSIKGLRIEKILPEEDKNSEIKKEIKEKRNVNHDWGTWIWLLILMGFTLTVIIFLIKKNRKRVSVESRDNKKSL